MAGIGFTLKKLVNQDDLVGVATAYMHSALISCGPWVFTIVSLFLAYAFSGIPMQSEGYLDFQAVLFYNFAFSLILTAPVHMVATRYIADCIYKENITPISASLLHCLALVVITQMLPVGIFYFLYVKLPLAFRLVSFINFFLLSFIWVLNVYLTALKNYVATTRAFALGMFIVFLLVMWLVRGYSETGILFSFDMGLAFIAFSLVGEVLAEYNYRGSGSQEFRGYFKKYRDLALAGTFYSIGVWGDKLVMAFAPEATVLKSGIRVYFEYNEVFFLAYVLMIPLIAMFILSVETSFFEHYRKFYKDILFGVPYHRIESNHKSILRNIAEHGRNMAIMQGVVCFFAMAFAHKLFAFTTLGYAQISMFRFAVMGCYFQVLALFALIVMAYFECYRAAMWIQVFFGVTNALFTYISMKAGYKYYGYGYFLSALLTFILATMAMYHYVRRLPYHEFIVSNILMRRRSQIQ